MATKDTFTADEWQTLEFAMTDTMAFLSIVDPGFLDMFKEASHAGRFVAGQSTDAPNLLVRDLAHALRPKRDVTLAATPDSIEAPTLARVRQASALVAEKAPEDLDAFKAFILGIADTIAEASNGVSAVESDALDKLTEALG